MVNGRVTLYTDSVNSYGNLYVQKFDEFSLTIHISRFATDLPPEREVEEHEQEGMQPTVISHTDTPNGGAQSPHTAHMSCG
jgi:hypothetical protein